MGEIIDYLLIFWFVLAIVVYIVGSILEAQEQSNKRRAKQRHKRDPIEEFKTSSQQQQQANRWDDNWSPYSQHQSSLNQQQQQQYEPHYSASAAGQAYRTNEQPFNSGLYGRQSDPNSGDYVANSYGYSSSISTPLIAYDPTQPSYYQAYDQSVFKPEQQPAPVAAIPTATGFNADWVEWVNNVLYLFFTQVDQYSPVVAECICRSLNERLANRSSADPHGELIVEFTGINRQSSSRPELTNIRTESETDRSVSVNCKIYNKQVSFNLSIRPRTVNVSSTLNSNNEEAQYELILENLEGKLKSLAMLNEKLIVIQFIEKPDTKILLKPRHMSNGATQLINEDVLVQIILQTLTQVMVDLYFGDDVDFPRFKAAPTTTSGSTYSNYKNKFNTILKGSASELKKQIKHDFFGALTSGGGGGGDKERKVFIKIVRARNINYNQNVTCLLQLDSPHQQAISSTKQGSSNPYWDEHFLFNVNEKSKELLLELWDSINASAIDSQGSTSAQTTTKRPVKGSSQPLRRWNKSELCRGAKFLGLVGVNIEELRKNPVQKVDLILEPMETPCNLSNSVGGDLQVELLFLEHSASPEPSGEDQPSATGRAPTPDGGKLRKSKSANSLSYQHGDVVSIDRKLTPSKVFIKIVRARNINYNQNVTCLLQLDSPHQQAISSTKQGSSNPYWDEHFLFNVNEKSKELLLELWDSINASAIDSQGSTSAQTTTKRPVKGSSQPLRRWNKSELCRGAKFLGLVGVNIEELRKNPVQKVDLILEPMETPCNLSNSVGGDLQVELLFLEHSASPEPSGEDQPSATGRAPTPDGGKLRKSKSANSLSYQHGDVVSIDRKLTPSGYVITTTTITKAQRPKHQQEHQQHLSATIQRNQSPISSVAEQTSLDDMNLDGISSSHLSDVMQQRRNELTGSPGGTSAGGPADRRSEAPSGSAGRLSRSRSRSRSFLRAIKKRFSFSRTRSRSVGESGFVDSVRSAGAGDQSAGLGTNLDAVSIESRSRASSEMSVAGGLGADIGGRAKSVPASRDPNEVPTIVINKGRLSDTASAFTFTHPKSQLVIEVLEPTLREDGGGNTKKNARLRYYAIGENAPNKRKWSKRGVKLHLFNEHQFVACHLAGSSTCHLCGRVFSRRPGKQGYKCRNCHLLSHKQCHVKVDHNCPYAKRDGLPLEYIDAEPPTSLMDEVGGGASPGVASQANQQEPQNRTRPIRMTAKSISMEVDDR